jgi:RsiW-degrading membrane proteinase PrsW (M82 family)
MSFGFPVLLFAALLPVMVLMLFIVRKDHEHPEPTQQLLRAFFFGVGSVFLSLFISTPLFLSGLVPKEYTDMFSAIKFSFGAAAIPEETAKLLMLWWFLRKNKDFDERIDGVVYACCVGLGFAAFENVQYIFSAGDDWLGTAVARGLLAVPGHFFFAVLMGYYYSLVHFGHHSLRNKILVLAAPVLTHGIYDSICMTTEVSEEKSAVLTVFLLLFCNELRKLGTRHVRELVEADKAYQRFL